MKNLKIVKDITSANAITHSGIFHADEVFATVLLSKVMPEIKVCRTFKVTNEVANNVIVYDIGGGEFDHHQRDFNKARLNGIKFSSFGLLWQAYGMQLLNGIDNEKLVFDLFDRSFVSGIDAVDNGQVEKSNNNVQLMSVSGVISSFNPNWDEVISTDERFEKAVRFAETIFDNALNNAISRVKSKTRVEAAIENSSDNIMILDKFMPWQDYIFSSTSKKASKILYVVFPSNRGGYNVNTVPDAPGSYGQRKPLPDNWAGLSGSELAEVSGIPSATFCHKARFLCGAETFEDALAMARKAVEA